MFITQRRKLNCKLRVGAKRIVSGTFIIVTKIKGILILSNI